MADMPAEEFLSLNCGHLFLPFYSSSGGCLLIWDHSLRDYSQDPGRPRLSPSHRGELPKRTGKEQIFKDFNGHLLNT